MRCLCRSSFARLTLTAIVLLAGCGPAPRGVLDSMARAYRTAEHYSDDARVVVRHTQAGTTTEATQPFRVAFSRPDRLRVEAYDARVVGDGRALFAAVGSVPGQVLEEEIRSPLDMDQLFADDAVRGTLTEGEAGCPPQLPLLLADDTLDVILSDARAAPRIVGTETIDGHACHRVAVAKPDGTLELWIDRASAVLRRMRVPTAAYADDASRQAGAPVGIAVDVEFAAAAFAPAPAEAFAFEVPSGATRVARLEPLDRPLPPHPRLGTQAGLPPLATADGASTDVARVGAGPVVLEFFFDTCTPATRTMPEVAAGIATAGGKQPADRPPVRHVAVSLDPEEVSTPDIRRRLAEFGGVGTLARDPQAAAARALALESFPATVIVAGDGTVADVIVGDRPRIAADVAETLTALARGEATVDLVRARHRRRLDEYRRDLARAADGASRRTAEPVVAPRRQPDRFTLRPAWRTAIALPGNVVCIDATRGAEAARIVALDGWRSVVELGADGSRLERRELDLPADAAVAFLRSAVTARGTRWWLGGRRGAGQVFVFDDAFGLHAAYPARADAGDRIAAADLADLDGDGIPEVIVGFRGDRGVEVATLDGHLNWSDRTAAPVADLAVGPPAADGQRGVLFVAGGGRIGRATSGAAPLAGTAPPFRPLRTIAAGPVAADGGWAVAGIAGPDGRGSAFVGIDPLALAVTWDLPLVAEARDAQLEAVTWADLLGTPRRQWMVAAADGSVTVAWADGRVVDRYCHGGTLLGIGGFRHADRGHVVLATADGVEALAVEDVALD